MGIFFSETKYWKAEHWMANGPLVGWCFFSLQNSMKHCTMTGRGGIKAERKEWERLEDDFSFINYLDFM